MASLARMWRDFMALGGFWRETDGAWAGKFDLVTRAKTMAQGASA